MSDAASDNTRRSGFTLVELLVVLFIMASLVTVASVSVGTTQDKARADKTAAIGRGVVEALERSEGLSFVSDFGRLPSDAEIPFLFTRTIRDGSLLERSADGYELRRVELPAANPPRPPEVVTAFGTPYLGAGWRGPYSRATELRADDGDPTELLDGWRNRWEVDLATVQEMRGGASESVQKIDVLRSKGRDGEDDGSVSPADWQDRDLPFSVNRNAVTDNIGLNISVAIRGNDGELRRSRHDFDELTLKVLYFSPQFGDYLLEDGNAENRNIGWSEFTWENSPSSWAWRWKEASQQAEYIEPNDTPFNPTLTGLTAGQRLIFLYATGAFVDSPDTSRNFVGGPRSILLQPGTNRIEFTLNEL